MLDLADAMKADRYASPAAGRPRSGRGDLRQAVDRAPESSFSVGIAELGGYPLVIDGATSQLGEASRSRTRRGCSAARSSAIVWRTFAQDRDRGDGGREPASRSSTR